MLLDGGLPGLLPLIPFTSGGADLSIIERTAELVQKRASANEAEILESLLFVFAARAFDASVLLAMMRRLHMSTEIIEKSAFYQEALAKGMEQGMEQGIEQGKAAGLRDAILVILRARFGEPTSDLTQTLGSAHSAALEDVLRHALDETLDQVRVRLGL